MSAARTVRPDLTDTEQPGTPTDLATTRSAIDGYRRLGAVAAIVAAATAASLCLRLVEHALAGGRVMHDAWDVGSVILLFVGTVSIAVVCWRSLLPARAYVTVALVTEFLVSAGLGAGLMGWQFRVGEGVTAWAQVGGPPPFDLGAGEVPWAGIWIVLFAAVIPLRPAHHLAGGLLSIATLLFWPAFSVATLGAPAALEPARGVLTSQVTLWLFVRGLLATGMAYGAARSVYGLRRQLAEARKIGSYRLREKLGEGGMGEVWRADHQMLARSAAIKLIRTGPRVGRAPGGDAVRRFEREVQAAAQLRSPHTIEIYDYGLTEDGTFYCVMELLDGQDLEQMVKQHGQLPWRRVVHILAQVCHSLAEAHDRGLIHRDIKPANILLCRLGRDVDQVKVLDFGLVKATAGSKADAALTQEGVFVGTPAYSSPETASGDQVDHRGDLYSLGCVAFWLLTGRRVFQATTPVEALILHARERPPAPSECSELEIPEALDRIVLDCLAKDPAARPASAEALAARLTGVDDHHPWSRDEGMAWWRVHRPSAVTPVTLTPDR